MSKKDFEGSIDKLETIVASLESGKLTLDESIAKFEEGIKLYKNCRGQLSEAEKKIQLLTESLELEEYKE